MNVIELRCPKCGKPRKGRKCDSCNHEVPKPRRREPRLPETVTGGHVIPDKQHNAHRIVPHGVVVFDPRRRVVDTCQTCKATPCPVLRKLHRRAAKVEAKAWNEIADLRDQTFDILARYPQARDSYVRGFLYYLNDWRGIPPTTPIGEAFETVRVDFEGDLFGSFTRRCREWQYDRNKFPGRPEVMQERRIKGRVERAARRTVQETPIP